MRAFYEGRPLPRGMNPAQMFLVEDHFEGEAPRATCWNCCHFRPVNDRDRRSPGDCHAYQPTRWTRHLWTCERFRDVIDAKPGDGSVHPAIEAAVAKGWRNFHRSGDL